MSYCKVTYLFISVNLFLIYVKGENISVKYNEKFTLEGKFSQHNVAFELHDAKNISLVFYGTSSVEVTVNFYYTNYGVLKNISSMTLESYENTSVTLKLEPLSVGHTVLFANATPAIMTDFSEAYAHVSVSHTDTLIYVSDVVGWLYFIAWSVSFYPQIILNFKRKSVIGLHFDYLALNIIGFFFYSLFNIGLYWIPSIEEEYFSRHKFGVNPVQLNDVIFSIHAFFACIIQVVQCIVYDRGEQQVSCTARVILALIGLLAFITTLLGATGVMLWLDFLYFVSYVKLFITLIKYIPQAYYNYQRKSTSGWSIGNVLLDCTGGTLSIAQMFVIAYNYSDWGSIFGDPTKFGLGLFSILFDVLFMVQHYWLYRRELTLQPLLASPEHIHREPLTASIESTRSGYGTI